MENASLAARLLDEERYLSRNLPDYEGLPEVPENRNVD